MALSYNKEEETRPLPDIINYKKKKNPVPDLSNLSLSC